LQDIVEINKKIAAADQVDPGERRIFEYIVLCKNTNIPDDLIDAIGIFIHTCEKFFEAAVADTVKLADIVNAKPCF